MMPALVNYSTPAELILAVSLELASKKWKLALHDGQRENAAIRSVDGEDPLQRLQQVIAQISKAKAKWGLPESIRTVVLFESGQDGFWIARALEQFGVEALICDPASLQVARHARRAKTDRLDAIALVSALRAWLGGKRDAMRIIRIPDLEAEEQRHLARDRGELQKEVSQHRDRTRKLLRTFGCWANVEDDFKEQLEQGTVRCYDGSPLPQFLLERLLRECERMELAKRQFEELEKTWFKLLPEPVQERVSKLQRLKAIGDVGSERLVLELFWRKFENRRQVGASVGLVPQPFDSGNSHADQGISKQGNRRVRSLLIEMSWLWLRYQPDSAISRWFAQRTGGSKSKRGRRMAIVAVARRLVIALWRYLEHDVVPDGAKFKPAH